MVLDLRPVVVFLGLMTLLLGGLYPLTVRGMALLLFPEQAEGSLVRSPQGTVIGSTLIGQAFSDARYFHPRPSAVGHDASASGASNLAATSPELVQVVRKRILALHQQDPHERGPVPADLVTASGSGLDPDLSPQAALWQVPRIAKARSLPEQEIRQLINAHQQAPLGNFLGDPRVNVLKLNLALDALGKP